MYLDSVWSMDLGHSLGFPHSCSVSFIFCQDEGQLHTTVNV